MGCTQSSSHAGSSIPPQQINNRPATKDAGGGINTFAAIREKMGIKKVFDNDRVLIDSIVAAASTIAFEGETVNGRGNDPSKDVKSATMSAVEQAIGTVVINGDNSKGFNVANWAVNERAPFGDFLISICESAFVGFKAMVENKPAADHINDVIIKIVRLLPLFLTFFGEKNDLDGKKIATKLLENAVASMLLARELSAPQGGAATGLKVIGIPFLLRFFNVTGIKEALAENRRLLFNSIAVINYWTTGRLSNSIANNTTQTATNQSDLEHYLKPLTLLNPPVTDAIQFWRNASDFKDLEDVVVVIEALLLQAVKAGFLKIEKVQGKKFKKLHYFENFKNVLDANNIDVISVKEFKSFLSTNMKKDCESYRVADAVKVFIDSFSLNSFISVSAFKNDKGAGSAADNRGSVSPSAVATPENKVRLRGLKDLLSPTGFGLDLLKYWSQYMEGSRLWLFAEIDAWISSKTNPSRVFLIVGESGFGKSTFAAKLVDVAKDKNARLFIGGHYFCRYNDSKRRSPCQMIATLAYQLAKNIPDMEEALSKIGPGKVKALASGVYHDFERVFDELLAKPLTEALSSWPADRRVCLLIDALDELDGESPGRAQLLSLVCNGLLSLPNQVHIIVTSRPDKDILAHLQLIKPLEIEKRDEKQRRDLRLFAKKVIVDGTTLKTNLTEPEKEDAINVLLVRSKGLFTAMKSSFEHLKRMEKDENRSLTRSDVISLPSNLVDTFYQKSMARIFMRIDAIEDPDIKKTIEAALKRALATLLASNRPLTVDELANLCSGVTAQDELLTKILLDSLSPLFSFSTSGPIEPLHKTFYDFLLDKNRSKLYSVDVSVGHLILAFSCARILQGGLLSSSSSARSEAAASSKLSDKDMFFEDIDSIFKNDALGSVDIYALDFGHVHLSKAIICSNGNNEHLIEAWESLFLTKRGPPGEGSGRENVLGVDCWESSEGKRFYKSNMMAKESSLKWILLQAKSGRNSRFTVELEALEDSIMSPLDVKNLASGAGGGGDGAGSPNGAIPVETVSSFKKFLSVTRWLLWCYFNAEWTNRSTQKDGLKETTALTLQQAPITSEWFDSPAAKVGFSSCAMTLPIRVGISQLNKMLVGHSSIVVSVAFNRDASKIVSGSQDRSLKIWDAFTGEVIYTLNGHKHWLYCVSFSADGSKIVSGSGDKTIKVWNAKIGGEAILTLSGHTEGVRSVSFSTDGTKIVSGSDDCTLKIWDARGGKLPHTLTGHTSAVNSVCFSADGSKIASASHDCTVRLWNPWSSDKALLVLSGHKDSVYSVCFSPNCSKVVSGSNDHTIKIWNPLVGGEALQTLLGHSAAVNTVRFSLDGLRLVSCSGDSTIIIWDVASSKVLDTLKYGNTGVLSVSLSNDESQIVSGNEDKTIKLWDLASEKSLQMLGSHADGVRAAGFSNDGSSIAAVNGESTLKIYNSTTFEETLEIRTGHQSAVTSICFSLDGSKIVSASSDRTIIIWNARTGGILYTLVNNSVVNCVCFSDEGSVIVSGANDGSIRIWDAETDGKCLKTLTGHKDSVTCVEFSSDGSQVISGSRDNSIRVWNFLISQEPAYILIGHNDCVNYVHFTKDYSKIVSGSDDKSIKIWEARIGGKVLHTLLGHTSGVTSVSISGDESTIVSGSKDGDIKLWNFKFGGNAFENLYGHTAAVNSVCFSPNGSKIVSSSNDGCIKLWNAVLAIGGGVGSFNSRPSRIDSMLSSKEAWKSFVFSPESETILLSGLFEKKSGGMLGVFEPRQLVLTSKPCLYYIDILGSKTTKGTIDWNDPGGNPKASLERDNAGHFILAILAPDSKNRTFIFRSYDRARENEIVAKHQSTIDENSIQIIRDETGINEWVSAINSLQ